MAPPQFLQLETCGRFVPISLEERCRGVGVGGMAESAAGTDLGAPKDPP